MNRSEPVNDEVEEPPITPIIDEHQDVIQAVRTPTPAVRSPTQQLRYPDRRQRPPAFDGVALESDANKPMRNGDLIWLDGCVGEHR
ncbi:hypothetical protein niasHT_028699 [Heterodera trifolii]|uniref:Uncharacterized protein n=1 Tax=Heterodera trifolii TaxID=157864 RepID=A0ABD2JE67_9BILA